MENTIPFDTWYAEFKAKITALGLPLPEDIEMLELAHMEGLSVDAAVEQYR